MKLLSRIDFSSYTTVAIAVGLFWLLIAAGAAGITTVLTAINLPEVYANDMATVHMHTFIVSVLAIPVFFCFFALIRRIELLRRQLHEVVRTDDLTGLLSREAFLDDFRSEFETNQEEEVSDAFLIVDADFFKKINDNHGHIAGDKALVAITNALRKGIRATDRIGRLGGEEFAIHLRGVNKARAQEIAERLRKNVMEASDQAGIEDLKLSVSIGAVFYESRQDVISLLIAADRQLYRAKDNGRNRVEFEHRLDVAAAA